MSLHSVLETGKKKFLKGNGFVKKHILRDEPWTIRKAVTLSFTVLATLFITSIFFFFVAVTVFSIGLPDIGDVDKTPISTEILDRNGTPLYTIHGEENREYVAYEKISPNIINATISIEDNGFWTHHGFDFGGIAKAVLNKVFGIGQARGGSTITQQYAKNAFLTREKSVIRKIRELILAVKIEQKFDKKKILELYLNEIPYGNNTYGIQKASETYFGKNAADLTIGESAILAAIPQLPSYYNPYGNQGHSSLNRNFSPEEIEKRNIQKEADLEEDEYTRGLLGKTVAIDEKQNVYIAGRTDSVLKRMEQLGYITSKEKDEAWKETQTIQFKPYRDSVRAPHFVFYVKELLEKKYGKEVLENGGLKVYTTIDWKLQEVAEKTILERGDANEKNYKATDAAALFIDPRNGQILTMVGSRDYFNDAIAGKVNVTTRPRLPGSSFKPFVYAQAFLNRYSPATVLYDTPTKIGTTDNPQNYDGKYYGPMSMRKALPQSRNIPAIKAYWMAGEQTGIINLVRQMGIEGLDLNHDYGYPLAIGAGEVKMTEMVTAYSVFANNGKKPTLNPILKIENSRGEVLDEWKQEKMPEMPQVLDPQVAYLINNILSDNSVKLSNSLIIPGHDTATKTGTSTNTTKSKGNALPVDLWVMGYTPEIVGSVWVGNAKGDPMTNGADGSTVSAPIWKTIMTEALKEKPNTPFLKPEGIQSVSVSSATGLRPGPNTPKDKISTELFASFAVPTEVENIFFTEKIDKRNNLKANDFCPTEVIEERTFQNHKDPIDPFGNWVNGIKEWYKNKEDGELGIPPTDESPLCKEEFAKKKPEIQILSPGAGSIITGNQIPVQTEIQSKNGIKKVEYFFGDTPRFVRNSAPFDEGTIKIPKYIKPGEEYTIKVRITDQYDYTRESSIMIRLANPPESPEDPKRTPAEAEVL
ncbi:MAG: penicillin-binding protein [Patescibacteria group bacterium]